MAVKLIAIDIDGTLLDSRWQLSEANCKAIVAASGRGIEVTRLGVPIRSETLRH